MAEQGLISSKDLANALKTAINSVYGLTSASFINPCKDIRNKDNIVAKRGALFMIDLKEAVQKRGFTVVHIKTDSIKIAEATPDIIQFVMDFGKRYGYSFEHEATYERMCIVNKAVYIAKYASVEQCMDRYGYSPDDNKEHPKQWTATGEQFAVPYVKKKLFTHDPIVFNDLCETFSVSKGDLYLDMNEELPDDTAYAKELEKYESDYRKGLLNDISFNKLCSEVVPLIDACHNLRFIGKVGRFTPIKSGSGGGVLYRVADGKRYAASGTTGYRWLESEMIAGTEKENCVDEEFYKTLVNDAVAEISKYCDFEWFASDDPYVPKKKSFMDIPEEWPDDGVPFRLTE